MGKTALGAAGTAATAPFRAAAGGAMDIVAAWVADSAQWLLAKVVGFIDSSTSPDLDAEWFRQRYDLIAGIALFVLLPILIAATIRALLAQDVRQLVRCYFLYLPGAIAGMFVAIQLTQTLLVLTDHLSAAVSGNVADDTGTIFRGVGRTVSLVSADDAPAPSFAIFIAALLLIVGAFFVWLELLVRSAAVTVAVFFLPLIFAGAVWPTAGGRIARRVIETLFALIVSKFVIVGVISLATAAMADPGSGGFGTVMGAVALVAMAAFAPFAILKLIPVMESSAVHHAEAMRYRHQSQLYHRSSTHHVVAIMRSRLERGRATGGGGSLVRRPAAAAAGTASSAGAAASAVRRVAGATAAKTDRAADQPTAQTQRPPSDHSPLSPPPQGIKKPRKE
ncbi:MAG: hypothetical protein M3285_01135 [Actinomycetota bacterium]|nr:hypothetical protein [Actinomycetota bacterium]